MEKSEAKRVVAVTTHGNAFYLTIRHLDRVSMWYRPFRAYGHWYITVPHFRSGIGGITVDWHCLPNKKTRQLPLFLFD